MSEPQEKAAEKFSYRTTTIAIVRKKNQHRIAVHCWKLQDADSLTRSRDETCFSLAFSSPNYVMLNICLSSLCGLSLSKAAYFISPPPTAYFLVNLIPCKVNIFETSVHFHLNLDMLKTLLQMAELGRREENVAITQSNPQAARVNPRLSGVMLHGDILFPLFSYKDLPSP